MGKTEHTPVGEAKTRCGDHAGHDHAGAKETVLDPVCGMTVDPATSKHRFDHQGKTFHFCSASCRSKFAADPARYLDKQTPQAEPNQADVPEVAIYTCPMHPQIRQVGPGTCPI